MSPVEIIIPGAVGGIVGIVLAVIYLYIFDKRRVGVTMALIKCEECGIDLLVDGVEKFESKEVNARVDNCPNCGAGLMTKKEKIGSKSRNLEQVRRMSVEKRPR